MRSIVLKIINLAPAYGRRLYCNTAMTDSAAKLFILNAILIIMFYYKI